MVHIGQKIEEVVHELNMPVTEFASRINKSRTVIYNIFKRQTIDTGLLLKISEVLEYNFFRLYLETGAMANDPAENYGKGTPKEVLQQLNVYKKELDSAVEEINKLKKEMKKQKGYQAGKKGIK